MDRIFLFLFYSFIWTLFSWRKVLCFGFNWNSVLKLAMYYSNLKKQLSEVFCRKAILIHFTNFTGKHLCWSLFLIKFTKAFWRISANDNIKISIDQLSSQKSVLYKNLQIMLIRHSKKKCSTSLNLFKRGTTRFHSQIHKH